MNSLTYCTKRTGLAIISTAEKYVIFKRIKIRKVHFPLNILVRFLFFKTTEDQRRT